MTTTKKRSLDLMLGLFVLVGFITLVAMVVLIGRERRLFDRSSHITAQFPNVAGLNVGAEVLLAGVVVGNVHKIIFPDGLGRAKTRLLTVNMRISSNYLPWIKEDSRARVDSKGLLGDKTINISLGSSGAKPIPEGGNVASVTAADLNEALAKAEKVLDDVSATVGAVRKVVEGFVNKGGDKALSETFEHLRGITREIENGTGVLHQIIYDKESGGHFKTAIAEVSQISTHVKQTTANIDQLIEDAKNGKGLIHALVYDPSGGEVLGLAKSSLGELSRILHQVETGQGAAHSLIYDKGGANMVQNLERATKDLETIVSRVKQGEGTLGRLLIDPTIYEDLKLILGEVKRNEILKALVRFAISHQKKPKSAE